MIRNSPMNISNILNLFIVCSALFLLLSGCSESEQQRDFEDEARRPPSGITAMTANGVPEKDGEKDPSDWRTAPDFSGLFEVTTPAFPNPVSFNANFEILIDIKALDAIDGLYVYAFQQSSDLTTANPLEIRQEMLEPGLQSIIISPQEFASSTGTGTFGNTWRIIFYDRRQNVITYGDVLVE